MFHLGQHEPLQVTTDPPGAIVTVINSDGSQESCVTPCVVGVHRPAKTWLTPHAPDGGFKLTITKPGWRVTGWPSLNWHNGALLRLEPNPYQVTLVPVAPAAGAPFNFLPAGLHPEAADFAAAARELGTSSPSAPASAGLRRVLAGAAPDQGQVTAQRATPHSQSAPAARPLAVPSAPDSFRRGSEPSAR